MLGVYLCIVICAIIWIANGIWMTQAVKERFVAEIYAHLSLGLFFTLLALELTIGVYGAWKHVGIGWLEMFGWVLYIPSAILCFGGIATLKHRGKPKTGDPSYTTTFIDTGIYGVIRQSITLGLAVWSFALILVFQSILSIVLGVLVMFCCWISAIKESEYNIKKFGERYEAYMRRVPMWHVFK